MILEIDEERRISLGMSSKAQPVGGVRRQLQEGRQGQGSDQSITFGVFIGLTGGIDGLATCPICPDRRGEGGAAYKGDEVEAVVVAIDAGA
jgi:ribosomal protein S1